MVVVVIVTTALGLLIAGPRKKDTADAGAGASSAGSTPGPAAPRQIVDLRKPGVRTNAYIHVDTFTFTHILMCVYSTCYVYVYMRPCVCVCACVHMCMICLVCICT